jgi:hypothetical protein
MGRALSDPHPIRFHPYPRGQNQKLYMEDWNYQLVVASSEKSFVEILDKILEINGFRS